MRYKRWEYDEEIGVVAGFDEDGNPSRDIFDVNDWFSFKDPASEREAVEMAKLIAAAPRMLELVRNVAEDRVSLPQLHQARTLLKELE